MDLSLEDEAEISSQQLIEQYATAYDEMKRKLAALQKGDASGPPLPCEVAMLEALSRKARVSVVKALVDEWRVWFTTPSVWWPATES